MDGERGFHWRHGHHVTTMGSECCGCRRDSRFKHCCDIATGWESSCLEWF